MGTWNYTLNRTFVEEVGPETAQKWVDAIGQTVARTQPGDRAGAVELIKQQYDAFGQTPNQAMVDLMADNITLSENTLMRVLDSENHVLAEFPLPGRGTDANGDLQGGRADDAGRPVQVEEHEAPDDKDRPLYS